MLPRWKEGGPLEGGTLKKIRGWIFPWNFQKVLPEFPRAALSTS